MSTITFSPQQNDFFKWLTNGNGSGVLIAVAGAGKTTALLEGAKRLARYSVAVLCYNKDISDELKEKVKAMGSAGRHIKPGTVHSFGVSAYGREYKIDFNRDINRFKVSDLINGVDGNEGLVPKDFGYAGTIASLVSYAKQTALGVIGLIDDTSRWMHLIEHYDVLAGARDEHDDKRTPPVDEIIAYAKKVLKASIAKTDKIDFDDMCYMPLIKKLSFWKYDIVFVDEAQDLNDSRRLIAGAMLKKGGRLIAVGDPHQAIYGFTGANSDSLDIVKRDFNAIEMPLTVSFRCPKNVVAYARNWVDHIESAPTAKEGTISDTSMEDFLKRNDLDGDAAVLSRVTKPLVSLAFTCIRKRIPCKIEGRDIFEGLKKQMTKWERIKTLDALINKLDKWAEKEIAKFLAKKQEGRVQSIEDTVETIKVIAEECQQMGKTLVKDAVEYIDNLFAKNVKGVLVLSTIHKSKGREWKRVFWLDKEGTCPNKWARQKWQQDQEVNLMYVAATRAKEELIHLGPEEEEEEKGR